MKRPPCRECGVPAMYRCHKCQSHRCLLHLRFIAAHRRVGLYFGRCTPRCRLRMRPEVAERLRASQSKAERDFADEVLTNSLRHGVELRWRGEGE